MSYTEPVSYFCDGEIVGRVGSMDELKRFMTINGVDYELVGIRGSGQFNEQVIVKRVGT